MRYTYLLLLALLVACSTNTVSPKDDDSDEVSSSSVKSVLSSASNSSSSQNASSSNSSCSSSAKSGSSSSVESSSSSEALVGTAGLAWDGTTAKAFAGGAGTKLKPYIILTAEQLAYLAFVVGADNEDYNGKYYKLGADILLSDTQVIDDKGALIADSSELFKWTPIGNSSVAFTGYFDGDGHSVIGLFINTTSSNNGLFGNSSGTVENVTLTDSWIQGGKYTAGIVGFNKGTISNVANEASVNGLDNCTGGIAGESQYAVNSSDKSIIKDVVNRGVIVGSNYVAGIVASAFAVSITNAVNEGYVEGKSYVGGIAAKAGYSFLSNYPIEATNIINKANIVGNSYSGGLIGLCGETYCSKSSYSCGTITAASNFGDVSGTTYTGGAVGNECRATVTNASNTGSITGTDYTAGLFGASNFSTTTNLYNRGDVEGSKNVGGIIGYNQEGVTSSAYTTGAVAGDSLVGLAIGYNYNTTMADYYYLEIDGFDAFGLNNSGGVATGKTASEMQTSAFADLLGDGWTRSDSENDGYPIFSAEYSQQE